MWTLAGSGALKFSTVSRYSPSAESVPAVICNSETIQMALPAEWRNSHRINDGSRAAPLTRTRPLLLVAPPSVLPSKIIPLMVIRSFPVPHCSSIGTFAFPAPVLVRAPSQTTDPGSASIVRLLQFVGILITDPIRYFPGGIWTDFVRIAFVEHA